MENNEKIGIDSRIKSQIDELSNVIVDYEYYQALQNDFDNPKMKPLKYLTLIEEFKITNRMQREYLEDKYEGEYHISEVTLSNDISLYDQYIEKINIEKPKFKIAHAQEIKPIEYNNDNFIHAIENGEITYIDDKIIRTPEQAIIFPIGLTLSEVYWVDDYRCVVAAKKEVFDQGFIEFVKDNYAKPFIDSHLLDMYSVISKCKEIIIDNLTNTIGEYQEKRNYVKSLKIERSTNK